MRFSSVLDMLIDGQALRIAREAWPAGRFVFRQPGYPGGVAINANTAGGSGIPLGTFVPFAPYLMQCTADAVFEPWSPSGCDVLREDWVVLG